MQLTLAFISKRTERIKAEISFQWRRKRGKLRNCYNRDSGTESCVIYYQLFCK